MTPEQFGSPEGSPLFNGMSPGVSPTGETGATAPVSIASVLSASASEQTVVPSISVQSSIPSSESVKEHPEKHEEDQQHQQKAPAPADGDEGFRVL